LSESSTSSGSRLTGRLGGLQEAFAQALVADGRSVGRHEAEQQSGQRLAFGIVHEAPLQAGAARDAAPGFWAIV